jgi:hypothetical protein
VFLELSERHALPIPLVNIRVEGLLVDAFWPANRLVVELDGAGAHEPRAGYALTGPAT